MKADKIWKGLTQPRLAGNYIKRMSVSTPKNLIYKYLGTEVDVIEEDWDNLILLDACRYDILSEEITLDGTLEYRISKGSNSHQFIDRNFNGVYYDTVYVSGNPFLVNLEPGTFHDCISVFDEWDDELHTIPPAAMKDAAIDAHRQYPQKRLIVHFMQPHIPYLGPTGDRIREDVRKVTDPKGWGHTPPDEEGNKEEIEGVKEVFAPTVDGVDVSRQDLREAYVENLHIVLEYVEELVAEIDGKSVISADHGEHLGERVLPTFERMYGHPGIVTPELRKVPWYILDYEDRREITSDPPVNESPIEIDERKEKLKLLGYQ